MNKTKDQFQSISDDRVVIEWRRRQSSRNWSPWLMGLFTKLLALTVNPRIRLAGFIIFSMLKMWVLLEYGSFCLFFFVCLLQVLLEFGFYQRPSLIRGFMVLKNRKILQRKSCLYKNYVVTSLTITWSAELSLSAPKNVDVIRKFPHLLSMAAKVFRGVGSIASSSCLH